MKAEHSKTAETKYDTNIPNLPPVTPPLSKCDDDYNLEGCKKAQRGMLIKELFLPILKECIIIILELTLDGILAFAVCLIWARGAMFASLLDLVLSHGVQTEESLVALPKFELVA